MTEATNTRPALYGRLNSWHWVLVAATAGVPHDHCVEVWAYTGEHPPSAWRRGRRRMWVVEVGLDWLRQQYPGAVIPALSPRAVAMFDRLLCRAKRGAPSPAGGL